MTPRTRLGGFKILKDVVRIALIFPERSPYSPALLFRTFAQNKINLPYITCVNDGRAWGLNIVVESSQAPKASRLIEEKCENILPKVCESAILSIFPHRHNPEITGSLLELLEREGTDPEAFANSPSAISVVLRRGMIKKASNALFGPFSFSAYRTPADWKLAQTGKEQLYREVVASYQEKRPKVYGLAYQKGQEFLRIKLNNRHMGQIGRAMKGFARTGLNLTFLATSPCQEEKMGNFAFCLPKSEGHSHGEIINRAAPELSVESLPSAATFSMNGPHFGDRYGIASELLHALEGGGVDLLALSCSIASIIGVVPSHQIESAIHAIQGCFEVPSTTEKELP